LGSVGHGLTLIDTGYLLFVIPAKAGIQSLPYLGFVFGFDWLCFYGPTGRFIAINTFHIKVYANSLAGKLALFFQIYPCEMAALPISRGEHE
jgi:hypothetical protein